MTEEQLCALLVLVQGDLANRQREASTFALLRAVVSRRIVAPEVYDIMDAVGVMLVRSHSAVTRRRCSNVLLQFLLRYPLTPSRLHGQLEHFVKNLGYQYPDGRLAVLDMLHAVVLKFPREELNKQALHPRMAVPRLPALCTCAHHAA